MLFREMVTNQNIALQSLRWYKLELLVIQDATISDLDLKYKTNKNKNIIRECRAHNLMKLFQATTGKY
jgi:hypothetical protein